jgi:hypothetical protein
MTQKGMVLPTTRRQRGGGAGKKFKRLVTFMHEPHKTAEHRRRKKVDR